MVKDPLTRSSIRADICKIQLCQTKEIFAKAFDLFVKKWNKKEKEFMHYFVEQLCKEGNNGWYEGFSEFTPSTSNSIESTHKVMKDFGKLRSRMALKNFLTDVETSLIHEWSMERNPKLIINNQEFDNLNLKSFNSTPSIQNSDWDLAWKWDQKNKKVIKLNHEKRILI